MSDAHSIQPQPERGGTPAGSTERKLTAKQKRLVDTLVSHQVDVPTAAKLAGVSVNYGYKAVKLPHVAAHLRSELNEKFLVGSTKAVGVMQELMSGADSEKVRLDAAQAWLDRAGFSKGNSDLVAMAGAKVSVHIDLS